MMNQLLLKRPCYTDTRHCPACAPSGGRNLPGRRLWRLSRPSHLSRPCRPWSQRSRVRIPEKSSITNCCWPTPLTASSASADSGYWCSSSSASWPGSASTPDATGWPPAPPSSSLWSATSPLHSKITIRVSIPVPSPAIPVHQMRNNELTSWL